MRKTDSEKIKLINEYINEDKTKNYWYNKSVLMSDQELKKLNSDYWDIIIKNMIEKLDSYIYKTWKNYVSHYLTIRNWLRREWVKELPKTYICSYGNIHRKWETCDCF